MASHPQRWANQVFAITSAMGLRHVLLVHTKSTILRCAEPPSTPELSIADSVQLAAAASGAARHAGSHRLYIYPPTLKATYPQRLQRADVARMHVCMYVYV